MKQWFQNVSKTDIRNLLAIVWSVGAFAIMLVLILRPVPEQNKEVIYLAAGSMLSGVGVVLSFFFGASKREADADKHDHKHG